ncbi:hypothetical protein SAURM35S_02361 [Streptomyces aurantiogriseus]
MTPDGVGRFPASAGSRRRTASDGTAAVSDAATDDPDATADAPDTAAHDLRVGPGMTPR